MEYGYDNFGRRTSMKTFQAGTGWAGPNWPSSPGNGDETRWEYEDCTGLLTAKVYSDTTRTAYTYTLTGKLETRTWARGVVTTYDYYGDDTGEENNRTGELQSITYSDGTPGVQYQYDRLGRMLSVGDVLGLRQQYYNDSAGDYTPGSLALVLEEASLPAYYEFVPLLWRECLGPWQGYGTHDLRP